MTDRRMISLRSAVLALVAMTVVFGLTVGVIVHTDRREQREDHQEEVDSQYLACLRGNELRALMRFQTETAFQGGEVFALSSLPSFSSLPGSVRQYFLDIEEASKRAREQQGANTESPKARILAEIDRQTRDCEAEYPDHTPGLQLEHKP